MNIILSIKPKWAELIYSGKKTIEWRKSFPTRENIECVYLYETAPVKKVTGFFILDGFEKLFFSEPKYKKDIHPDAQKVIDAGCVPLEDLKKYKCDRFNLFGWKIKNPTKFYEPWGLQYVNLKRPPKRPPQSWCYDLSDLPL